VEWRGVCFSPFKYSKVIVPTSYKEKIVAKIINNPYERAQEAMKLVTHINQRNIRTSVWGDITKNNNQEVRGAWDREDAEAYSHYRGMCKYCIYSLVEGLCSVCYKEDFDSSEEDLVIELDRNIDGTGRCRKDRFASRIGSYQKIEPEFIYKGEPEPKIVTKKIFIPNSDNQYVPCRGLMDLSRITNEHRKFYRNKALEINRQINQ
jgi:hypothetical protein